MKGELALDRTEFNRQNGARHISLHYLLIPFALDKNAVRELQGRIGLSYTASCKVLNDRHADRLAPVSSD